MPYLISTAIFPGEKIPDIVRKVIEVNKKFPPDESLGEAVVPNALKGTLDGIKAISILEVKEGKLEAAITRTTALLNSYVVIPGYKYSIDVWSTVEEAYGSIGQKPPE